MTPREVTIVEVGPRDGLQNEPEVVPTDVKVAFVDALSRTGLAVVEATSFVHPRWVPQLADGAQVLAGVAPVDGVRHPVLVPNVKGLEAALAAGAREVAVFASASEAFAAANLNRTVHGALEMFRPVVRLATEHGLRVRGYVSMVLGSPWDGDEVTADDVTRVTRALLDMGCAEVSLGDTVGVGTPAGVRRLLRHLVAEGVPADVLALHPHDTYGQGLANALAAIEEGVTTIDASAGGLGGCPYAPGARGNLATEDLVWALDGAGVDHGVDLDALLSATEAIHDHLGRPPASRVAEALLATRARGPLPAPGPPTG